MITPGVALAGHATFENRRQRNFAKKLALNTRISSKRTNPQLQAIALAINTPLKHACNGIFPVSVSFTKNRQLKICD